MLLLGLVAMAHGDRAAALETCGVPAYLGSVPADGDQGLPADTVLTFLFDGDGASCGEPALTVSLRHQDGGPISVAIVDEGEGVFRAIPAEPLADGPHVAEVSTGFETPFALSFTVGGSFPMEAPGEPGDLELSVGRSCEELMVTRFEVAATFPDASPADRGVLRASVLTEDGERANLAVPYDGDESAIIDGQVLGGRELCVVLSLEDVTGTVAWELEPICAEEHRGCPSDEVLPPIGCSSAPSGGLALLPLVLLLVATRRRGLAGLALAGCATGDDGGLDTGAIPFTSTVAVDLDGEHAPAAAGALAPPGNLGNERTWCWTVWEDGADVVLYAIGGDSGELVEARRFAGASIGYGVTALTASNDRLIGAIHDGWVELDVAKGVVRIATAQRYFEPGLTVLDGALAAVTLGDQLALYPDFDALGSDDASELRPGFHGVSQFAVDGATLLGSEMWAEDLVVLDLESGAELAALPIAGPEFHVDGMSVAGGLLHVLDGLGPFVLHRFDPATGERLSEVELTRGPRFRPGGLWCDAA